MSYKDGMSAINLEMPSRVPRTEYSANGHWELVKKVTGIDVSSKSSEQVQRNASKKFMEAWNYDFVWGTGISTNIFGEYQSKMGHAVYASGGVDYDNEITNMFEDPEDALNFDPWETYGAKSKKEITEELNGIYKSRCESNPDTVNMVGTYVTLMSGILGIFGWDTLLTAASVDQERFGDVVNRYAGWMQQYYDALAECDSSVIMMHDDITWTSGPFIHPQWYRKYIFPNYKKLLQPLIEKNKKVLFTSDGNFTVFVDDLVSCGLNGFVMEPVTDMSYIAEKYGKTHVIVGNADTRVLLYGTREDIRSEVQRCMDIGKKCPGYFMAVGNHIPANTPVENALYYNEVYEELSKR